MGISFFVHDKSTPIGEIIGHSKVTGSVIKVSIVVTSLDPISSKNDRYLIN